MGYDAAMPTSRITPGLTGTAEIVVAPEHTAPFVGSGRIAVLATPVMINLIEAAALAYVRALSNALEGAATREAEAATAEAAVERTPGP